MNAFENIKQRIECIDYNMELKDDYREELDTLRGIENDISVSEYLGELKVWQIRGFRERIKRIKDFIEKERECKIKCVSYR